MQGQITQETQGALKFETCGKIAQTMREALAGSRKVKITLRPDAIDDIQYLISMIRQKIITISMLDYAVLVHVAEFRNWEHDDNRSMVITFTDTFEREHLAARIIGHALENIEVVE